MKVKHFCTVKFTGVRDEIGIDVSTDKYEKNIGKFLIFFINYLKSVLKINRQSRIPS